VARPVLYDIFTGHVNDPQTDIVYMQQRYYDPIAARFLSVDPVVAQANTGSSFNRYNYANGNPYLFTDPDGRSSTCEVAATLSAIRFQINLGVFPF
jgi:RHS repeat-associated protein